MHFPKYLFLAILVCLSTSGYAQQFVGYTSQYAPAQDLAENPAWAAHPKEHIELNLMSFSALAGTNAYRFDKDYVMNGFGKGIEGIGYHKDFNHGNKLAWGNIELRGPAAAFHIKNNIYGGIYTRMRELVRAGVNDELFNLLGDPTTKVIYRQPIQLKNNGFTTHTFSEIGFSVGTILRQDDYQILRAGATVKYLMGIAAATIFSKSSELTVAKPDSMLSLKGDMNVIYTKDYNNYVDADLTNDMTSWFDRHGHGSLGLDLGVQYEYHPNGNPNEETKYLYSISAALTDIGRISYDADTGSGTYQLQVEKRSSWQYAQGEYEPNFEYFGRMMRDSLVKRNNTIEHFHVGLPTALRIKFDWNAVQHLYVSASVLLNLKGNNGDVYRPGYASMINVTPRYETRFFMVGFPFSYIGYQTMMAGFMLRLGPLFLGSTSIISASILKEVKAADAYAGLAFNLSTKRAEPMRKLNY